MSQSKKTQARHKVLLSLMVELPSDFKPYGSRERVTENIDGREIYPADCSSGCKHFLPLAGVLGYDWGVCSNTNSPRKGLLTFEHQGCREFEE